MTLSIDTCDPGRYLVTHSGALAFAMEVEVGATTVVILDPNAYAQKMGWTEGYETSRRDLSFSVGGWRLMPIPTLWIVEEDVPS